MAEKIVSPGVFTKEIDASFLPAAVGDIGAAVVGPTVKGPALVPTVVNSYAEFQQKFGDTFKSGSQYFQYLTSVTAQNYLKHGSKLTVVRILDGSFSGASAAIPKTGSVTPATFASGSGAITSFQEEEFQLTYGSDTYRFIASDPVSCIPADDIDGKL